MVFEDYTVTLTHLCVGRAPGGVVKSDGGCVYSAQHATDVGSSSVVCKFELYSTGDPRVG